MSEPTQSIDAADIVESREPAVDWMTDKLQRVMNAAA